MFTQTIFLTEEFGLISGLLGAQHQTQQETSSRLELILTTNGKMAKLSFHKGFSQTKRFAINILNVGVFIFWGGVTIVSSPASGKSFTSFVLFFSIVLLSYFITDLLKISVANRFKSLLTGKGIVIVNSIVSLILIVSGVVLILKGV